MLDLLQDFCHSLPVSGLYLLCQCFQRFYKINTVIRFLFFHIKKEAASQQIPIANGFLSKLIGIDQFLRRSHPASDSYRSFNPDHFFYFLLDFLTDTMYFVSEFSGSASCKYNAYPIAAFLISNTCILSGDNFISYIKKYKGHQCAFLLFMHIYLIHF